MKVTLQHQADDGASNMSSISNYYCKPSLQLYIYYQTTKRERDIIHDLEEKHPHLQKRCEYNFCTNYTNVLLPKDDSLVHWFTSSLVCWFTESLVH